MFFVNRSNGSFCLMNFTRDMSLPEMRLSFFNEKIFRRLRGRKKESP